MLDRSPPNDDFTWLNIGWTSCGASRPRNPDRDPAYARCASRMVAKTSRSLSSNTSVASATSYNWNAAISMDWANPSMVTSASVGRFSGAVVVVAADDEPEESVGPVPGVVAPALPARNGISETAAPPSPMPSRRRRRALSGCAPSVTSMSTKKSFRDARPQPSLPGVSGAILEVECRQVWYPSAGSLDGPCPLQTIELRRWFDD